MAAEARPTSEAADGDPPQDRFAQLPPLPASVMDVYRITMSGTSSQRRMIAKPLLDRCKRPRSGRALLGHGGFGAVFRVTLPKDSSGASSDSSKRKYDYIAVKTVFNWGLSTSKLETIDSQKEFDVLTRLPEHRNLSRLVFECVCKPPVWMVKMLPDPSLVCVDAGDVDDEDDEMPDSGRSEAPLRPRKAQMMGMELLQRRMCDHMDTLEGDEPGSMPDDVLVQLSRDIAEGVRHLLQHGVVHRDLKLDNVMWDSKGGPEGVGRAVLIDLGCSLRVHVDGSGVGAASGGAASSSSSSSSSSQSSSSASSSSASAAVAAPHDESSNAESSAETAAVKALDRVTYRYLKDGGDGLGGNQAHLAPEVLDGWNRGAAGDDAVIVPYGKQASWELGVLLHELATGGQHPFGEQYPGELPDGSRPQRGKLATTMHACEALETAGHDSLLKRPFWYKNLVQKLLTIEPGDRMSVCNAITWLRSRGRDASGYATGCDIRKYLPALAQGEEGYDAALDTVKNMIDGLVQAGNWVGVCCVLCQLWAESGLLQKGPTQKPPKSMDLIFSTCNVVRNRILSCDQAVIELVCGLRRGGSTSMSAEVAACIAGAICHGSEVAQKKLMDEGALPKLVSLLESSRGKEAEYAARALGDVTTMGETLQDAIVDAGALPRLVRLLDLRTRGEATQTAHAMFRIIVHARELALTFVEAGALPRLVALLRPGQEYANISVAQAIAAIANAGRICQQAVVDRGALPALVALLGSGSDQDARSAILVLDPLARGPDSLRKAVFQSGVQPGLVRQLGSSDADIVNQAAVVFCSLANWKRDMLAILHAGAIPALLSAIKSCEPSTADMVPNTVLRIACSDELTHRAYLTANVFPALARLLGSSSDREASLSSLSFLRILSKPSMRQAVLDSGALPGLVQQFTSNRGSSWWFAGSSLEKLASGPECVKRAIVDAGVLPPLMALLGPNDGSLAVVTAEIVTRLATGPADVKQAVADAGALPGLVAQLKSTQRGVGQSAARALCHLAMGSEVVKQAAVDAGALAGLVAQLESRYAGDALWAARALCHVSMGPDGMKQAVVDSGALSGLVQQLVYTRGCFCQFVDGALARLASGPECIQRAFVDASVLPSLIAQLRPNRGRLGNIAVRIVAGLATGPADLKQALVDAGALPGLVAQLRSTRYEVGQSAARALCHLAMGPDDMKQAVVDAGALKGLVALLVFGNASGALWAARALCHVSMGPDGMKQAVVDAGALIFVVGSMRFADGMTAELAAEIIRNLAAAPDGVKQAVADAGAIPALVTTLGSGDVSVVCIATEAVYHLCLGPGAIKQAVVDAGALDRLVTLLRSSNSQSTEWAAGAVQAIATGSHELAQAVVDAGAVDPLKRLRDSGSGDVVYIAGHAISVLACMARGVDPDVGHPMKRRRVGK